MRAPITHRGITTGETWVNARPERTYPPGTRLIKINHIDVIGEEIEYLRLNPRDARKNYDPIGNMSVDTLLTRYTRVD